ncbi:capsular biosynthesis protein [Metabacillus litoralis]|uniref:YveK family protein n=1 Tax=Metabacillus TaxID=2675233 RepID=UPI000EF63488|nr:Wzz/FepE/Etk N-terminal domain-containing protein [Metabacillus litoralis]MCM3412413.1 capsular biosynthesis protein [Metabacillus litoralis]UHA57875.1 capsular biosynthesis protein [Metabacillus litoralis]
MSGLQDLDDKQLLEQKSKEINIRELLLVIKRYLWIILLVTVISTSAGTYYSISSYTPMYQSASRMILNADSGLMSTLKVIIQDTTVLEKVVEKLDLPYPPEVLSSKIMVASIGDSKVVTVTVTDSDPKQAAILANSIAETYKEEIPGIIGFNDVKLLSQAKEVPFPINEDKNKPIIYGFAGGIVVSIGLAFLLNTLNNSIRKEHEVEELLGLPVLGTVPKMKKANMQGKQKRSVRFDYGSETIGS